VRLRILGVPIDDLRVGEAVSAIVDRGADPASPAAYVVKPYVEFFDRRAGERVHEALEGAWLSLADGVAVQWAAAYAERPRHRLRDLVASLAAIVLRPDSVAAVIPERVAGVTFTLALLERCRERGLSVFLVGSPKHAPIARTAEHIATAFPGLRIAGTAPGRVDRAGEAAIAAALRHARPDVVLVGVGFPRQELLMARLVRGLDHGVLVGEGGSFDFRELGGAIPRAPERMRRMGLEWLWRLAREPRRLRRQLAIPRFVARVHREALARRRPRTVDLHR
jgi:N-acetylglucosaminyldiphosphoundecaprenol N-acetyl-beta-D-mannosaminyltransferase